MVIVRVVLVRKKMIVGHFWVEWKGKGEGMLMLVRWDELRQKQK